MDERIINGLIGHLANHYITWDVPQCHIIWVPNNEKNAYEKKYTDHWADFCFLALAWQLGKEKEHWIQTNFTSFKKMTMYHILSVVKGLGKIHTGYWEL